jgi:hypothetical protein
MRYQCITPGLAAVFGRVFAGVAAPAGGGARFGPHFRIVNLATLFRFEYEFFLGRNGESGERDMRCVAGMDWDEYAHRMLPRQHDTGCSER